MLGRCVVMHMAVGYVLDMHQQHGSRTRIVPDVYLGEALAAYGFGGGHPFGPDRMDAFWHEAERQGLDQKVRLRQPVRATDESILGFHSPAYVERVRQLSETGEGWLDAGDTPAFRGVYEAAATVAGSVLAAVDAAMKGEAVRAFVPIAGLHHARRDGAAGFCVFNDIGIAIAHLRAVHGVRRIAYVDIDAHHGDGVFYAFEDDPDVWIADTHEDGRYLYPGTGFADETGLGAAAGSKLNLPLPPGADDAVFSAVWPEVEAHVHRAEPQFIILQCGADSIAGDPITHLRLHPSDHGMAAGRLCALADTLCAGRFVALGGGGYDRANLAAAWCAVLAAMVEA
jgi:acetoin utilization protein AcuC